ncbi:MAG: transcription elongation factor GreB [Gammaproteobacteria bacterium]|nr:transcription elongation factor GreB [Gammaproteobacteria bacterium]
MSRWRPPREKSSPYITAEGYQALEQELKALWAKRRIVNDALAAAAAEGDRSENAEYLYRKKEQAGIDRRIRYLQKRMPDLNIVERVGDPQKIFFGAFVTVESEAGETRKYRIVGPDETDRAEDNISIDSPLARALLKKSVDDEVSIKLAGETHCYTIMELSYLE